MKQGCLPLTIAILFLLFSCSQDSGVSSEKHSEAAEVKSDYSKGATSSVNSGSQGGGKPGLITAGEWNDLSKWDFWKKLLTKKDYSEMDSYWGFYTNHRISVTVKSNEHPLINAKIELLRNGTAISTTKTDNLGNANLWVGMFQNEKSVDLSKLSLKINGELQSKKLVFIENGVNEININSSSNANLQKVELSFIVDATGSMGDELNFLKEDLKSVINSVKNENSNISIYTSTVFYRDEGDDYVVKKSTFTNNLNSTIDFISQQQAGGGGDFPEAVHTALNVGINELQWSNVAKTRIAFLLLDAPPHYNPEVLKSIHNSIKNAYQKGIKIIPITASGIDKKTEFLMRFMAIATNGTYVFITNHSGIGGNHIEASVGQYKVEKLNNLMIRLIKKYTKFY